MNTKAFSLLPVVLVMALAGGCQIGASAAPIGATAVSVEPLATLSPSQIITLGDIDSDEPAKKIRRFQPLADYLATHLAEFGIKEGRVVIAWDIPQMGLYLKQEKVDLYFDSAFPALGVQKLSDSEVILRRWKQGAPTYWSVYIARRDRGITSSKDFMGKVLAFEEPHSTSGFILPAGTLIQRGFNLVEVVGPESHVAPHQIGYFFTRDEENTVELVLAG